MLFLKSRFKFNENNSESRIKSRSDNTKIICYRYIIIMVKIKENVDFI